MRLPPDALAHQRLHVLLPSALDPGAQGDVARARDREDHGVAGEFTLDDVASNASGLVHNAHRSETYQGVPAQHRFALRRRAAARVRRLQIDHLTEYHFGSEVTPLPHRLLLRPREIHGLRIASSMLEISPAHRIRWQRDAFDNSVAVASFTASAASLRVAS